LRDTEFRDFFSRVANTVSIVCISDEDGTLSASTISSLGSVSVEQESQKILLVLRNNSRTGHLIKLRKQFSVNVLADHQTHLAVLFSKEFNQWEVTEYLKYEKGVPVTRQSLFSFICTFETSYEVDRNEIIIGRVDRLGSELNQGQPLVYVNREYSQVR
jgi:flavin reductase (DIM6/NTAB) family NADH-FMN oxidoreductase RutF